MTASAPLRASWQVNGFHSTQGEGPLVATPSQVSVWIGLDVGKESHFAYVLDNDGERLFSRAVRNDQGDLEALLDRAGRHGVPGLVIDQPGSIAQLILAVAARREVPVAYVPGLVMRRAADLYPGEAKTDQRDAYIIADTARTRRKQVHWLDAFSDELLAQLRVLNGFDTDLAVDQTRVTNRLRDALTSIAPALERAIGKRLGQPGVRDLVADLPTLTALRAAGPDKIRAVIARRSPRIAGKTAEAVAKALAAQDVTMPAEAATGRVIAELARELDRIHQRRDALEKRQPPAQECHVPRRVRIPARSRLQGLLRPQEPRASGTTPP
jgi:hypothetical protein